MPTNKKQVVTEEEMKEITKETVQDAKYAVASATGKLPSDVTVTVKKERVPSKLAKESSAAGGKKSRRTKGTKYNPTDDDYGKVEEMVLVGIDHHTIAKIMGIGTATLHKYFQSTMDTAKDSRNAKVAGVAYQMAISGESYQMTKFWLDTQADWTSKKHIITEDKSFDISWDEDAPDIADANQRDSAENNIH